MDSPIPFELITNIFAAGSVVTTIISGLLLILLVSSFTAPKNTFVKKTLSFVQKNSLYAGFLFSFLATAGSLFMSEMAGFVPCELCWYQRVFMYPQAFVFLLALYYRDAKVFLYSLFLSSIGLLIALWHVFIEYQPKFETCSETSISCSSIQFQAFGFVTIPFMSASIFLFLVLVSAISLRKNKKS